MQPATGVENLLGRDTITTLWTLFAPIDADILATDRVLVYGTAYEVDGPVRRWATGVLDHKEVNLRAVAG